MSNLSPLERELLKSVEDLSNGLNAELESLKRVLSALHKNEGSSALARLERLEERVMHVEETLRAMQTNCETLEQNVTRSLAACTTSIETLNEQLKILMR